MAYLICRATFGNGVRIGMIEVKLNVLYGVVLGGSIYTLYMLLAVASALLVRTTAAGFDVCQDRINYPFPSRRRGLYYWNTIGRLDYEYRTTKTNLKAKRR